jgi:hypothetical protein
VLLEDALLLLGARDPRQCHVHVDELALTQRRPWAVPSALKDVAAGRGQQGSD